MYKNKKIIAIVPARGGSKGIPLKNIYEVAGKPLIAYTLSEAVKSKYIDYILVSTDSEQIADVARKNGGEVPFLRPDEIAGDKAKTIDCILDAIDKLKDEDQLFDAMVLLQPTSPLRTVMDIDGAIEKFFDCNCKSLVSVSEVDVNPVLIREVVDDRAIPILNRSSTVRRQDFKKYYRVNGAIYINAVCDLNADTSLNDNEVAYIMDAAHGIDIDTPEDVQKVEAILCG